MQADRTPSGGRDIADPERRQSVRNVQKHRPRILIFVDYFYPGFKGGGPIRTVANLIEHLSDEFDFRVVTGDRDLGDPAPFAGTPLDQWVETPYGPVWYVPRRRQGLVHWRARLKSWDHDAVYLNSLYSRTSIRILALRRLGLVPDRPCILAPRGELSPGALGIKPRKKRLFLQGCAIVHLLRGVVLHASTALERDEIVAALAGPVGPLVRRAPNLTSHKKVEIGIELESRRLVRSQRQVNKRPGALRLVFVSRISPKKNLDFALRVLGRLRGDVSFDVVGPIEDQRYWQTCLALAAALPGNVRFTYCGEIEGALLVMEQLARRDVFFLPTRSENFGHVILEALLAGCPVVVSDQTPWRDLQAERAGWDLPLSDPEAFVVVLQRLIDMGQEEFLGWSSAAHALGVAATRNPAAIEANRELFRESLSPVTE